MHHGIQLLKVLAMLAEAARCVRGAGESGTGEAGNQALAMAAGATLQALAAMNAFASLGEYEATVASAGVGSKSEDGGGDCPAAVVDGMVGWVADVLALARAATTATGPAWVNGCNEDSEALWRAVRGASGASWALAVACGAITRECNCGWLRLVELCSQPALRLHNTGGSAFCRSGSPWPLASEGGKPRGFDARHGGDPAARDSPPGALGPVSCHEPQIASDTPPFARLPSNLHQVR